MRIRSILLLLMTSLSFSSRSILSGEEDASSSIFSATEEKFFQIVVGGNNRFGFDFFQTIKNQPGNFIFSPYSITSGLTLAASGAKGETAYELQRTLHYSLNLLPVIGDLNVQFSTPSQSGSQAVLANALWVQKDLPLISSYKLTVQHELRAHFEYLDFFKNSFLPFKRSTNGFPDKPMERSINC